MTIRQVIEFAKSGKLKNMPSIANNESTILGFINLGLIELYKRFPISVNEYVITLQDGVTIYDMPSDYMWTISAYQEVPAGSVEPVSVVPINEEDNPESLNTIGFNKVQVPVVTTGAYISVIYMAAPPFISVSDEDFVYTDITGVERVITEVPLPPQMVGALLDYIAYEANDTLPYSLVIECYVMALTFSNLIEIESAR